MTAPKVKNPDSEPASAHPAEKAVIETTSPGAIPKGVKIVPAYPIHVEIVQAEGTPPLTGQILKLTEIGFLMRVNTSHFYKVGESYTIQFEIPVVGFPVATVVRVIKTYDAMEAVNKKQTTKTYTIEMHFKALPTQDRLNINNFLVKSGQKKF